MTPPGYWMHETGEELIPAVRRYLDGKEPLSGRDVALLRAYLVQWIESPVWDQNPHLDDAGRAELQSLREAAGKLANRRAIDEWVEVATDWGMDPL